MIEMLHFLLTVSLVALATGQKGQDDPCVNYRSLTDERRSISHSAPPGEPSLCDNDIDESVWYRFQTLLPQRIHDACVPELKCGTEQPIWIRGTHPTAADPGPKDVEVCSPQGNDCCGGWRSNIKVKFCPPAATGDDAYYVYRLKRVPRCVMAYCSGEGAICAKGSAWNPNSKTCTEPHPNIADPVFEGPIIVKEKLMGVDPYDDFYFICKIQWTDSNALKKGEQFEVTFTFDGTQDLVNVPPKKTDGSNLNIRLSSRELKGHVGQTVGCQVRSYWKMVEGRRSNSRAAQGSFFVGIKYSTTNLPGSFTSPRIEIDEKSPPLALYFQATVPISCPMTNVKSLCTFSVTMADIAKKEGLGMDDCSITFTGLDIGKNLPAQIIKAQTTPGINNRASVLRFKPIVTNPEFFWHGYQMPDIPIIIKDTSTSGVCESSGDPHITTFDKRLYHVYTEGDYLLAKSTERHFEVHARHHKYGGVTCNCAVAVREGNNVLGINFCGGPHSYPSPITYLRDDKVPGATITLSGNSYLITMPSGAYLRADFHRGWLNSILYLYLHLNSEDHGKTSGLCGTWNGNAGDDNIPKGTTTNDGRDIPIDFSNSYRLSTEESFLNGQVRPIPCLNIKDLIPNICTCSEAKAVTCAAPDPKTTTFVTQFSDNCNNNKIPPNRKRRSADSSNDTAEEENRREDMMTLTVDDIPMPTFDETHGVNYVDRWPTASGITKAQAENHCQAKMEVSPVYQMCKTRMALHTRPILDGCVADAQALDNLTVATAFIATEFQRICVHQLEISVVSDGSSSPTPEEILMNNVVSMICPSQCNGNGNCRNGTCVCNTGFAGEDCSVNTLKPPEVTRFRKGIKCDFRKSYCQQTAIFASNYFLSEKFNCKITAVDHSKHFMLDGSQLSNGEVVCNLPPVFRFTDEKTKDIEPEGKVGPAPFYRWDVSLTNDGSLYSKSLRMTVYDSKCQEYRPDGTTVQKPDTCLIGGRCFKSGEASRLNRCQKCFPSKNRDSWTRDSAEKDCPNSAASLCSSISIIASIIFISVLRIHA